MQRGHTPLFYATAAGQIESLRELLDSGASVNQAGTVRSTGQDCTLT
jgi:ankyrin repeat protein